MTWQYEQVRYRYRVLGTTQALRADGTSVPLGGARLRALLTALAVAGGRPVRTDTLVSEVWAADEEPPTDELAALQALVGRLRRALGREAVASGAGGYQLVAERDDIDLFRFERLADEGAQALADGDPGKAVEQLDDALALWRGPALADLPDGDTVAARAQARQLAARRSRLEAECALGRAETALPALRELATAHPLDEPLWALYLRALRDTGRQAEALAAYEEVRVTFADRLGTDPGPELRALHGELLGTSGAPDATAHPTGQDPAGSVRPGNLRARLTSFVGRETDVEALRGDLSGARLVTLLGPGGAGKTRLSQEAAEALGSAWPDGVWLAELAPVRDPEALAEAVLTALGGRETVIRGTTAEGLRAATDPHALDPLAQLAERCAARRMLLVLDNCEHVIDAAARLVETLLTECPRVTVLATSREPLGVPGERVRPVEPLPDPVALRLLADRGGSARAGFRVEEDLEACAEICRRLDGLPLAIELAAARLRSLTPRQLADRLDDRFRLLTGGSRTVLPRQQALRAVVDWSWDLLDDAERAVLRRLAVFSGGCGLAQAEEVCADPAGCTPVDPRDIPALLGALVDKSLVVAAPAGDGAMRYRLLETVGEYAAERLDEAAERPATERRHLVAYRELARTTDPLLRGPGQREHLERLEREHDNLRTALRWAVTAHDEQEAFCLVLSLHWFWELRGHRSDASMWSQAALNLGPHPFLPPGKPAPSLRERCTDRPPPMPPEQLEEARRGAWLIHFASTQPDMIVINSPEMRERLEALSQTYQPGQPQVCRPPGISWFFAMILLGDYARLGEILNAAVSGTRELGDDWALAAVLQLRSKVLNDRTDALDRAALDADESLEIFTRIGDQWGVAEALAGRGETRERRGDLAGAAADYRRAAAIAEELGAHAQVPMLRARLAGALLDSEEDIGEQGEDGERMLYQAVEDGERSGGDAGHFARVGLALRLGRVGRTDEARQHLAVLREKLQGVAPPLFFGMLAGVDGWLDVRAGRPQESLPKFLTAVTVTREDPLTQFVAPQLTVWQLASAAEALAELGRHADAARLLGAFDVQEVPLGSGTLAARESRGRAARVASAALGEQRYEELHREGGGLSVEEAATLLS
ncbi:AfsR family transcriptional regulator [Streptomyces sp. N2-109]|uniref:AfsR family transcriptional regulator n=1 Tax=Streptomyces gossypii TaxID=2883101 RepID=A0ABT2JQD7_9ACTN|nr:BTAD domain-containing putative transcriptional regulator [Streptomyces gossypii]MCT2590108.1 AfsR family transcriptional regulator [Streptomyces gossypii]